MPALKVATANNSHPKLGNLYLVEKITPKSQPPYKPHSPLDKFVFSWKHVISEAYVQACMVISLLYFFK